MTDTSSPRTIAVTGATGTIGSQLLPLLDRPPLRVRALVRDPDRANPLARSGAQVVVGELGDPRAVRRLVEGAEAVFLACGNVPGQLEYECTVIDEAARAGVGRIVKLSARGAEIGSPAPYWHTHGLIERHLAASGVPAVCLRPGFLMTNLLASAEPVRRQGLLIAPAGGARIGMIDPRDVAAAAAATLLSTGHEGASYVLTGPAAISFAEVATALGAITGRSVSYLAVPDPAAVEGLVQAGLPQVVAEQVVGVFARLRAGVQDSVTDTVTELTGTPARRLVDFLRDHRDAFGAVQPVGT